MDYEKYIEKDILEKYEFYNYGHALEILCDAFPAEWKELQDCLRRLRLTLADLKKAGGNESPIPKKFDEVLYPYGWREIRISKDQTFDRDLLAMKREHSRKPDEIIPIIEACSQGSRIELFARGVRQGWDMWGNQATADYEPTWDTYANHTTAQAEQCCNENSSAG